MTRAAWKNVGATAARALGADRLVGLATGRRRQPLVLCYHRVVEDVRRHPHSAPAMLVSCKTLEEQLAWVGKSHRFIDLDELGAALAAGRRFRHPVAAVTFDDGYADVYHNALPLLRRMGIPAALFVVSGMVGTTRMHVHDELNMILPRAIGRLGERGVRAILRAHGIEHPPMPSQADGPGPAFSVLVEHVLRTLPHFGVRGLLDELQTILPLPEPADELYPMSFTMLREAIGSGFIVGSHTHGHRVLPSESRLVVSAELATSKRILEQRLGREIAHVAYPDGQYSPYVLDAAAQAGYRFGYTTCSHGSAAHPLLAISRRTFWERSSVGGDGRFSPSIAACQAAGLFDIVRPCRLDHGARPPHADARHELRWTA